jgi:hypothetical protein
LCCVSASFGGVLLAGPIAVKAGVWAVCEALHANGWSLLYTSSDPFSIGHVVYMLVCILLLDYLHDAWFYWTHRLLHWKPLYRHVHYLHHRYTEALLLRPSVPAFESFLARVFLLQYWSAQGPMFTCCRGHPFARSQNRRPPPTMCCHLLRVSRGACRSTAPTAFTGYSFHVAEALLVFANEIIVCFLFPIDLGLHRSYHIFTTLIHQGVLFALWDAWRLPLLLAWAELKKKSDLNGSLRCMLLRLVREKKGQKKVGTLTLMCRWACWL